MPSLRIVACNITLSYSGGGGDDVKAPQKRCEMNDPDD